MGCHNSANIEEKSWVEGPGDGSEPKCYVRIWFCYHNNWGKTAKEFVQACKDDPELKNKVQFHGRADLRKADVFCISIHDDAKKCDSMGYDASEADKGTVLYEKPMGIMMDMPAEEKAKCIEAIKAAVAKNSSN